MTDSTPRLFLTSKYGALFIATALFALCLCLPTGGHATVDSRLHVGNEHVSFTWSVSGYRGWGSRKIRRKWGRFYGDLSGTLHDHLTSEVPDLTLPRFEFGRPKPPTQFVRKLVSRVKRADSAAAHYLRDNPNWGNYHHLVRRTNYSETVALSGPRRVLLEYHPDGPVFRVVGPVTTTRLAVHTYKNWLDLPGAVSLSQSGNRVAFSVGQRLRVIEFVGGDTEAMDVTPFKKAPTTQNRTNPIATKWFRDRFLGIFYDVNLGGYLKHVLFDSRSRRVIDRKRLPWDAPASKGKWGWTIRGKWRGTVSDQTIRIGLGSFEWSVSIPDMSGP